MPKCFETDEFLPYLGICLQSMLVSSTFPMLSLPSSFLYRLSPTRKWYQIQTELVVLLHLKRTACLYFPSPKTISITSHIFSYSIILQNLFTLRTLIVMELDLLYMYVCNTLGTFTICCRYYSNFNLLTRRHRSGVYCWMRVFVWICANSFNSHCKLPK